MSFDSIGFDSMRLKLSQQNRTAAHQQNLPMLAWYSLTGDINALS